MIPTLAHVTGSGLDDWGIVAAPLVLFGLVVGGLAIAGRARGRSPLLGIAESLERLTGVAGWAVASVGVALGGLTVAALGFYWDVSWHIDLGRDKQLFTPPHTMILIGLGAIGVSALVAILLASVQRADVGFRIGRLHIPWSGLALGAIGGGAVMGFPLDDLWHATYGVDVTMWGPTHLIMIGGASIATVAAWMVLGEAGARPARGTFAYQLHGIAAGGALAGMSALQGEFDFGVPQFQLLYHPVLIMIAAGVVLTAARIALGRGGALRAAVGFVVIRGGIALAVGGLGFTVPRFPLYVAPALAVELAAWLVGTGRLRRFGLAAGAGIATIGLGGEWAWSHIWGRHPWGASLLPEGIWVSAIAALGAAILGAKLGAIVAGPETALEEPSVDARRVGAALLVAGLLATAVALALPIKRTGGEVTASVAVRRVGSLAFVDVTLDPADAAADAHWFEVMSWQGGTLIYTPLVEVAPGRYRTDVLLPVTGHAKTLVRLHRGSEMIAAPVWFPADPEINAPEIPAVDRTEPMVRDTKLIMREAHGGSPTTARVVYATLAAIVAAWIVIVGLAGTFIDRRPAAPARRILDHGDVPTAA
jgi:hypothetical protein